VQTGIGVPHISGQQIKDFPFLMPSIDQQRLIAIQLDELKEKIHQLEFIYQQKIAALDELKKSLLHQAFSGELTQTFKTAVAIPFSLVKNDMEKMEQYANH
jgi:type I restriction enzyme S subunit